MKQFAVLSVTLIGLLSTFYAYSDQPDPATPEAVNAAAEIHKPGESATSMDEKEIQKPTESEALDAAATYLKNKDGRTVEKTEFIAWGKFSENDTYWPIKFRMAFKRLGSDKLSQNEYALKISRDSDGNWQAAPYWAWRTDFK